MGRKTWESLPARYRPLPGRENWVLTRDPQWSADGAVTAGSFDDVRRGATSPVLWVVGGGDIYAQSLTWADECFVTEIDAVFEGDSWAPRLGSDWSANDTHPASSDWQTSQPSGLSFRYRVFERNR